MIYHNIFDQFVNNEEVSEMALCAMYDLLKKLTGEFRPFNHEVQPSYLVNFVC